jgi:hypothetical protein
MVADSHTDYERFAYENRRAHDLSRQRNLREDGILFGVGNSMAIQCRQQDQQGTKY